MCLFMMEFTGGATESINFKTVCCYCSSVAMAVELLLLLVQQHQVKPVPFGTINCKCQKMNQSIDQDH